MLKRLGETPLVALGRLRIEKPRLREVKLAYAGRLDPMASGKMLVVIGDECKNIEKYFGLDKTYEIEVLFGIGSDTGDILGIVNTATQISFEKTKLQNILKKHVGYNSVPYPAYSSKTVSGKPLFQWTLEGRLSEIDIPVKKSRIYRAKFLSLKEVLIDSVVKNVRTRIAMLPKVTEPSKALGRDFRREEVLASWGDVLASKNKKYLLARIRVTCSSGTYMRSLAQTLARELGTEGLAFSINRLWIGKHGRLRGWL